MKFCKILTMSVQFLVSFTTFLLENQNFLSSASVIKDSSLHNSTLYIRGSDFDCPVSIYKKHFVKLDSSTFLSRKTVDKDLHSSLNFKLMACNIHNCVHIK